MGVGVAAGAATACVLSVQPASEGLSTLALKWALSIAIVIIAVLAHRESLSVARPSDARLQLVSQ